MDIARTLYPHAAIAIRITSLTVAGVWAFFLGLKVYCIAFWPEHPMLQATDAEAVKGATILSSMFSLPFMAAWLLLRRVSWHVDSKGISVRHGEKLNRSLSCTNIIELRMLPHYIVIRRRPRPDRRTTWHEPTSPRASSRSHGLSCAVSRSGTCSSGRRCTPRPPAATSPPKRCPGPTPRPRRSRRCSKAETSRSARSPPR